MLPCNNEMACIKNSLPAVFALFMLPCSNRRACLLLSAHASQSKQANLDNAALLSADDMCQVMDDAAEGDYR